MGLNRASDDRESRQLALLAVEGRKLPTTRSRATVEVNYLYLAHLRTLSVQHPPLQVTIKKSGSWMSFARGSSDGLHG